MEEAEGGGEGLGILKLGALFHFFQFSFFVSDIFCLQFVPIALFLRGTYYQSLGKGLKGTCQKKQWSRAHTAISAIAKISDFFVDIYPSS